MWRADEDEREEAAIARAAEGGDAATIEGCRQCRRRRRRRCSVPVVRLLFRGGQTRRIAGEKRIGGAKGRTGGSEARPSQRGVHRATVTVRAGIAGVAAGCVFRRARWRQRRQPPVFRMCPLQG